MIWGFTTLVTVQIQVILVMNYPFAGSFTVSPNPFEVIVAGFRWTREGPSRALWYSPDRSEVSAMLWTSGGVIPLLGGVISLLEGANVATNRSGVGSAAELLRAKVQGEVIAPQGAAYDEARKAQDGSEETARAGELYHWPAGHTAVTAETTVFIEVGPVGPMRQFSEHAKKLFS